MFKHKIYWLILIVLMISCGKQPQNLTYSNTGNYNYCNKFHIENIDLTLNKTMMLKMCSDIANDVKIMINVTPYNDLNECIILMKEVMKIKCLDS